jgi:hypothetical protein
VNLVNEKDRFLSRSQKPPGRSVNNLSQLFDTRCNSTDLLKNAFCFTGQDSRQSRLSCPRRSVENDRTEPIGLDESPKNLSFTDEVFLAHKLIKRLGTHSGRKGLHLAPSLLVLFIEQGHSKITADDGQEHNSRS